MLMLGFISPTILLLGTGFGAQIPPLMTAAVFAAALY